MAWEDLSNWFNNLFSSQPPSRSALAQHLMQPGPRTAIAPIQDPSGGQQVPGGYASLIQPPAPPPVSSLPQVGASYLFDEPPNADDHNPRLPLQQITGTPPTATAPPARPMGRPVNQSRPAVNMNLANYWTDRVAREQDARVRGDTAMMAQIQAEQPPIA